MTQGWVVLDLGEDLAAVHAWQVQVEQDEVRCGEVGVLALLA